MSSPSRSSVVSVGIGIAIAAAVSAWLWYDTRASTAAQQQLSTPPHGFEAYNVVALALAAIVAGVTAWWYVLEYNHRGGSP